MPSMSGMEDKIEISTASDKARKAYKVHAPVRWSRMQGLGRMQGKECLKRKIKDKTCPKTRINPSFACAAALAALYIAKRPPRSSGQPFCTVIDCRHTRIGCMGGRLICAQTQNAAPPGQAFPRANRQSRSPSSTRVPAGRGRPLAPRLGAFTDGFARSYSASVPYESLPPHQTAAPEAKSPSPGPKSTPGAIQTYGTYTNSRLPIPG